MWARQDSLRYTKGAGGDVSPVRELTKVTLLERCAKARLQFLYLLLQCLLSFLGYFMALQVKASGFSGAASLEEEG